MKRLNNNLPPESQQWVREVENILGELERQNTTLQEANRQQSVILNSLMATTNTLRDQQLFLSTQLTQKTQTISMTNPANWTPVYEADAPEWASRGTIMSAMFLQTSATGLDPTYPNVVEFVTLGSPSTITAPPYNSGTEVSYHFGVYGYNGRYTWGQPRNPTFPLNDNRKIYFRSAISQEDYVGTVTGDMTILIYWS